MKHKHIFIILGAVGIIFLLFWLAVITLVFKNLRGSNEGNDSTVINVTLCDEDASNLCIITFGANNLNRMVIHFQLPDADYAPFYVKATNRGTVSVYSCEVDKVEVVETEVAETEVVGTEVVGTVAIETEVVKAAPTSAHCTGIRTPLGETIDIEVYTTDGDKLIGRGTFLVSAIALSTPISLPSETSTEEVPTEEIPTEEIPTEEYPTEEYPTEETPTFLPEGDASATPEP